MRLHNRVAIVTMGANGIGLACAEEVAREGARIVIADVDEAGGMAAAATVGAHNDGAVRSMPCDVGDKAAVTAVVDATVQAFGSVDIISNNAGIIHGADFLDLDEADFDRVLRINLKGAFLMGQAVARQMVEQGGGGAIVNMSSVNAVMAIPNQVPYVVSKGGLNQLTKVMALALAPHGIRVNGIGPGSIATDMLKTILVDDAARRKALSRTSLGRPGEPR